MGGRRTSDAQPPGQFCRKRHGDGFAMSVWWCCGDARGGWIANKIKARLRRNKEQDGMSFSIASFETLSKNADLVMMVSLKSLNRGHTGGPTLRHASSISGTRDAEVLTPDAPQSHGSGFRPRKGDSHACYLIPGELAFVTSRDPEMPQSPEFGARPNGA